MIVTRCIGGGKKGTPMGGVGDHKKKKSFRGKLPIMRASYFGRERAPVKIFGRYWEKTSI